MADPVDAVDMVATDQTEVEVLVAVVVEDPVAAVAHLVVQAMDQAAMVVVEVVAAVVDSHSYLTISIQCLLQ